MADVGLATAQRTPPRDGGVTTAEYGQVPVGSTLPGVGAQVVLFLAAPADLPDGETVLTVHGALRATGSSPDLLAPSSTPVIAGVSGALGGQQAPAGWLAAVPGIIGSRVGALPVTPG